MNKWICLKETASSEEVFFVFTLYKLTLLFFFMPHGDRSTPIKSGPPNKKISSPFFTFTFMLEPFWLAAFDRSRNGGGRTASRTTGQALSSFPPLCGSTDLTLAR
ncbi:hypothetical protein NLX67_05050 [Domibacillus sp. A3M-37]|uniref:hypothetical protein n=1 Tax=Domibacillus sp. A3M-37 TaxID=2962037 RepID=UPI0020B823EB|nr:hypothetical protein [Domibacillus sp. A3M-37]MCP3761749.1 hypothetical protein [Domibacillus sp. A3M-37]